MESDRRTGRDRRSLLFRPGGRRITDPEPSHATRARYRKGCTCCPCRAANAAYEMQRWQNRKQGKVTLGQRISPQEARRRLKELKPDIPMHDLAERLGLKNRALRLHPEAITVRKHLRIALEHRRLTAEGPDQPLADIAEIINENARAPRAEDTKS